MAKDGGVDQNISGNDNIQINSGTNSVTAIGDSAIAVGGDFIQLSNGLNAEKINQKLEKIAKQQQDILKTFEHFSKTRLKESAQGIENELDDLEKEFAEADLHRKPNPNWPDTPDYATMVVYADNSDEKSSKIYLGHTNSQRDH